MFTHQTDIIMEPLDALDEVARQLLSLSHNQKIWLMEGGLGAGKTTLIKHVCQQIGVSSTVQSPTFSLVNEYLTKDGSSVFHFDLYRLKNLREAYEIGIDEYIDSGSYCFIEWPDVAQPLLPENSFRLTLKQNELGERVVSVPSLGPANPSIQ